MKFRLNPDLEVSLLATEFQIHSRIRIEGILPVEVADYLADCLEQKTPWHLVYSDEQGAPVILPPREMAQITAEDQQQRLGAVLSRARSQYQYLYYTYPILDSMLSGADAGHPLHAFAEFLNGTDFIRFARTLTGVTSLVKADPQATLYSPGTFLSLHDDETYQARPGDHSIRRIAFVFGFTRQWSPNWGGQLLLYRDADGEVEEGWPPGFNILYAFSVPTLHAVNYVVPFAGNGRYSITGWLRDDPSVSRPDLD